MPTQKKRSEPEKKTVVVKESTKQNNNNKKVEQKQKPQTTTTTTNKPTVAATSKKTTTTTTTKNEKQPQQTKVVEKKETKQQQVKVEEQKPKSIIKQKPTTTTTTTKPVKQQESKKVETTTTTTTKKYKTKEIVNQTISVGCYENSILGFEATYVGDIAEPGFEVDLQMTYGYSSHTGCVKALASTKNILVSSSTDETLKVYDLKKRVEFGQLTKHDGFVTCIQFYKNTHMFASSMDNTISVWRVSDWECLKVMSGPKGAVNSISIHPSGKVALSVSKDRRLFLWDLTKGTSAHFIKLKSEGFNVQWSPSGNHYVIVFKDKVVVYNASNFEELVSLEFDLQVLAIKFLNDDILMVGGEDKLLTLIEYKNNGKIIKQLSGHDNRIKAIDTLSFKEVDKTYVVTASSDGLIIVWDPLENILPVGCAETGFRLTTLTVGPVSEKVKKVDDDDDEDDEQINENNQDDEKDSDFDSEDEEAIANQPTKKMKVNIEMEGSDVDDEENEEDDEEDEDFDEEDGEEIDDDDEEDEEEDDDEDN